MDNKEPFRLINYASHKATENMAIDEAILEAHLNGDVPPTLRVYQFSPPAVSFGYAQKINNNLIDRIQKQNLAVVRRPTGGRAVLHMGDITYAFICSSKSASRPDYALVGESIIAAYKQICQALIIALQSLGVQVSLDNKNDRYQDKHDCFLATTSADLQYQGKKIAGSAQLRRRHGVLQHGSIILNQSQTLLPELLGNELNSIDIKNSASRHVNLYEIVSGEPCVKDLEAALKFGFEKAFENQFMSMPLTMAEKDRAAELESALTMMTISV